MRWYCSLLTLFFLSCSGPQAPHHENLPDGSTEPAPPPRPSVRINPSTLWDLHVDDDPPLTPGLPGIAEDGSAIVTTVFRPVWTSFPEPQYELYLAVLDRHGRMTQRVDLVTAEDHERMYIEPRDLTCHEDSCDPDVAPYSMEVAARTEADIMGDIEQRAERANRLLAGMALRPLDAIPWAEEPDVRGVGLSIDVTEPWDTSPLSYIELRDQPQEQASTDADVLINVSLRSTQATVFSQEVTFDCSRPRLRCPLFSCDGYFDAEANLFFLIVIAADDSSGNVEVRYIMGRGSR